MLPLEVLFLSVGVVQQLTGAATSAVAHGGHLLQTIASHYVDGLQTLKIDDTNDVFLLFRSLLLIIGLLKLLLVRNAEFFSGPKKMSVLF